MLQSGLLTTHPIDPDGLVAAATSESKAVITAHVDLADRVDRATLSVAFKACLEL